MANGQLNNNLLDEAITANFGRLAPNQYLGNNMEDYILSGGDPFMAPDVTKMHFYTDKQGLPRSTQYLNEVPGPINPMEQMAKNNIDFTANYGPGLINRISDIASDITFKDVMQNTLVGPSLGLGGQIYNWGKDVDWTDPHNFLPALGMGLDYFGGLGAPFDLADGALYQIEGSPGMASLAYGSMFVPVALAGGKRGISAGLDMATGHANTGQYLSSKISGGLLGDTFRKGKSLTGLGRPLVNDASTTGKIDLDVVSASKLDDIDAKFIDDIDIPTNVPKPWRIPDPDFMGNPNIARLDMGNLPPNLDKAYNTAIEHTFNYKTGAEAFERFKLNYPRFAESFKNLDEFNAFIKSSIDDITAPGKIQYLDADFYRHEPWGQNVLGGHHGAGTERIWKDDAMRQVYYPDGIVPGQLSGTTPFIDVAAVKGLTNQSIAQTTAHEIHHALTRKIWIKEFELSPDYQKYILNNPEYLEQVEQMRHLPKEVSEQFLKTHRDRLTQQHFSQTANINLSQGNQELNRFIDQTYRAPHSVDHIPITGYSQGAGDNIYIKNFADRMFDANRPKSDIVRQIERKWMKDYPYLTKPDEIGARVHEIRFMDDAAKKESMIKFGHPYGHQGQQILDYHPNFFKDGLFNQMYGMAPIGLGLGYGRRSLLDYTSDKQSE